MATLIAVLLASLFGSLHCAGMCGALVAFAVSSPDRPAPRAGLHVAYHGGRLLTYALLGAICGALGAALDLGGSLLGIQRVAAIMAGGMMVLVGGVVLLRYSGVRLPQTRVPSGLQRLVNVGHRAAMGLRPLPRAATIGLLTTLLPCGWLYAFAIVAAGTGSPLWGAAVMAAFWVGTVPVLLSLGVGVPALTGALGRRIPVITSLVLVAVGLYTVAGRITLPTGDFQALDPAGSTGTAIERVQALEADEMPCCQDHGE